MPSLKAHLIFWPISIAGIILDLWSKAAVFDWLKHKPQNSFTIIGGFFRFVLAVNDGAAFGFASGQRWLLTTVSIIALIAVFAIFLFSGYQRKLLYIAMGLFTAGICGNLYDRIFNASLVRDFIDIVYWPGKHWPAFNAADLMLCVAVGLMLITCFERKRPKAGS